MRNLDQKRAQEAWNFVDKYSGDKEGLAKICKQSSTRILNSGLCPAMAYLFSQYSDKKKNEKETPEEKLHKELERTLGQKMNELIEGDTFILRHATDESLAYLGWLARFAEAQGKKEGEQ